MNTIYYKINDQDYTATERTAIINAANSLSCK